MYTTHNKDVLIVSLLLYLPVRLAFLLPTSTLTVVKREFDSIQPGTSLQDEYISCEEHLLHNFPGTKTYISYGEARLCSLFIAAPIDHVILIEFVYLNVRCEENGAVVLIDGWELDNELFPSDVDHPDPLALRYLTYCGKEVDPQAYTTKQNVAQVQFVVPELGGGFSISVNFLHNDKPCNMMLLTNTYDMISLRNFGLKRNCTVMSIYPQRFIFGYINVGKKVNSTPYQLGQKSRKRIETKCHGRYGTDRVQLFEGENVGSSRRRLVIGFCGSNAPRMMSLQCHSSTLRMESSGHFYNVVKFAVLPSEDQCK
ncbi:corticotropin-releasing factor-binding protein-like isoform X4 [Physella acuta]|uniref:corticotropin-releasing factor-binding protein-like isoform X1 n=1 Tax=Physella acuta TaxID=109671 RepID=UPI0027DDD831|nr:corticotropin-releasing factor-binding protein-like isoform X1 [Physella acuta]XP_059141557.1 corticotropin-releasing factor-binding protein-like isoform X2 [Physella acuta]XP_059141558.1 corticotropin-releasing factor-binding protein-like isoform X3 [Physella acuta]XP_059141559.1 corticotropin-releasing factor-binding protein-like isoform X4 [Physella acuta]